VEEEPAAGLLDALIICRWAGQCPGREIVGHHHRWRSYKLISTNLTGLHVAILRLLFLNLRYTLIDSPKMMGKVFLKSTGHSSNSTGSFGTIMLEAPIPGWSVGTPTTI
jgi:hypothetical protein